MKKFLLILAVIVLLFSSALAQGVVLWEQLCPDGYAVFTESVEGGNMVRCEEVPTPTPTPAPTQTPTPSPTTGLTVDYNNLYLFDQLTVEQLEKAKNTKMVFMDRSVGQNMNMGLNCFAASSWESTPAYCRVAYLDDSMTSYKTYTLNDPVIPNEILFPTGMSRANWVYDSEYGDWEVMVQDFIQVKVPYYYSLGYKVMSFQFSYLNVNINPTLDDRFFDRNYNGWNIVDLEQLEADYPDVTFIYWTTSLARTIGTPDATSFNNQMRQYISANNKFLIDMADIESHGRLSGECLLNGNPIICREYTTETSGGHLGAVSEGMHLMSKAIWLIMGNIP